MKMLFGQSKTQQPCHLLRFFDSFDHYAIADVGGKWTARQGSSNSISASNGRRSTNSFRLTTAVNAQYISKTLDAQATWIIGFSYKFSAVASNTIEVVSFLDAGTVQIELRLLTDGTLRVTRNGTTLATGTAALSTGVTYYIEFKVTINNSAGAYEVRVDGSNTNHPSGSGADTQNTANASANQVRLGNNLAAGGTVNIDYDDFYICDGTGGSGNDFLGDRRADAYFPIGNGNSSQLTGSDGNSTDNYLLVDESSQDGDTSYVQSSTSGQKDTYDFPAMSHTPTDINGIQINNWAKKDDSGARSICSVIRSGGSDTDGASQALGTSYADYAQLSITDPNTAVAWTKTGFGSAEYGAKVSA